MSWTSNNGQLTWVSASPPQPAPAPVPAGWGARRDSAIEMPPGVAHANGPAFVPTAPAVATAVPAGGHPIPAPITGSGSAISGT